MKKIILPLFFILILASCGKKSEYTKLVETELAKNVRFDSLFLGIHFGMEIKSFYDHCWDMNKKGIMTNAPGNMSVQYDLDSSLMKFPTFMRFYPNFHENKIYEMPMEFQYKTWSAWDKSTSSDNLLPDVQDKLEDWYGGEFIEVTNDDNTKRVLVMVQGNRRIRLWKKDLQTVRAVITDLTKNEEALKAKEAKASTKP